MPSHEDAGITAEEITFVLGGDIFLMLWGCGWVLGQFPILPPKAYRWVPEMQEISKTLAAAGITPKLFEGAAEIYRFVAATPLGKETPENRDKARDGREVVRLLANEQRRS